MQKTAIIGTGIAGMGCARFLYKHADLTIYEQNNYVGGHTNTVTVDEDGKPVHDHIDPKKIINELDYGHPLFDVPAINAQAEQHKLNETGPIYFCGSYFKCGFHEDAFASAVQLCSGLLGEAVYG